MEADFKDFVAAGESGPATDDDIRGIGKENGRWLFQRYLESCVLPAPGHRVAPQAWRQFIEQTTIPNNLATMRAGGWTEDQITIYVEALRQEIDGALAEAAMMGPDWRG